MLILPYTWLFRVPAEKVETSPLKLLPAPTCNELAPAKVPANCSLNQSTSDTKITFDHTEHSSEKLRDTEEEDCTGVEDVRNDKLQQTRETEEQKIEETTEQRLHNIAKELLQTERAYVARLHLLDQVSAVTCTFSLCRTVMANPRLSFQVFCARLTEEAGRGSFPPEVIKNIFSNVSSIYSFHSQFLLPDLENCLKCWYDVRLKLCLWWSQKQMKWNASLLLLFRSERPGLGDVLLQHGPFLRMYADYVRNFDQAVELVRVWNERSSAFRNIIQDIQVQVCSASGLIPTCTSQWKGLSRLFYSLGLILSEPGSMWQPDPAAPHVGTSPKDSTLWAAAQRLPEETAPGQPGLRARSQ